ncbi:hypothetical protein [Burkholderia sp. A2]|uniref:hypothetical protein n=1 Tax=Burkholderia sp. A2 TaxID=236253 RepID=UPI000A06CD5A|nr:hypothetical protein [Burkholderia sp. A2]
MNNTVKLLIAVVLLLIAYFGYRSTREPAPAAKIVDEKISTESGAINFGNQQPVAEKKGEISIPKKFQLAEASAPDKFETDEDLKNSFNGSDRLIMDEFYKNFNGNIIAFNRPGQYAWLVKNGYPLPEDVIAAHQMSSEDLGKLVEEGNFKASYFYLIREVFNKNPDTYFNDLKINGQDGSLVKRNSMAEQTILKSGSPFIGYIWGMRNYQNGKNPESLYAGYALAAIMGDGRALNEVAMIPQGEFSQRSFVSSLSSYIDMVKMANPSAFAGRTSQFPDMYSVGVRQ